MSRKHEGPRLETRVELTLFRNDPLEWFLLAGNRIVVTTGLLGVVSVVLWAVVFAGLAPLEERTPTLFLLFALIGGNFTLIAIVVSISQFVLARHLESPGDVRGQMREMIGYRQEISELTRERVVPVTPSGLFELLFRSIHRDVKRLQDAGWTPTDPALGRDVDRLLEDLDDHVAYVRELLEASPLGIRYALLVVLDTNYSRYFSGVYRVRDAHAEDLPDDVADAITSLEEHIEQLDVARRYFKTIFIQSELATLSRLLLYIGLPVQLISVVLLLFFTAPSGPAISSPVLAVVVPVVVTLGFAPILLLATYILRLATVVQRTAAMYPFTTRADP